MKLLVALLLLASIVVVFSRSYSGDCSTKLMDMDDAVDKALLLTNPNLKPYTDAQDFRDTYCNHFMTWVKTISAYRSCLKSFQKTVFSIIVSNMKKNFKTFCQEIGEEEKIVRHSKCFIPENKKPLQMQVHKLTGIVEYVADRPNPDDMIPGLCCGFQLLAQYLEVQVNSICNSTSGNMKTGHFFRFIIENNMSDALDIMCGNYDSIQACETKSPHQMEELKRVVENSNIAYNHTAFVSLLRFIERMDSTVNVQ